MLNIVIHNALSYLLINSNYNVMVSAVVLYVLLFLGYEVNNDGCPLGANAEKHLENAKPEVPRIGLVWHNGNLKTK
jgi:hypothetical protein